MVLRTRLGPQADIQTVGYGETVRINGVQVSFHPAGHILGSSQIRVEHGGQVWVVSGDYKTEPDPTCTAFEPVRCQVFITESTFGLPIYRWSPQTETLGDMVEWWTRNRDNGRASVIFAYALGKAQRVIRLLREAGWDRTIFVHGALERLNALYERHGVDLGPLEPATTSAKKQDFAGQIVIAPPSATQDRWSRRFPDPVLAFASGWMQVRARARQRGVELPLVISDHADWDELTATVDELRPGELWITHGREEALARWAELHGVPARALALVGYEEEDDD